MKKILALIDFSDASSRVLQQAEMYAKTFGSHVVLMHVLPPDPVVVDFSNLSTPADGLENMGSKLQALANSLAGVSQAISVSIEFSQGVIIETILEWSQRESPDLIIMGSHGRSALYQLLVGSVTAGILKEVICPVLVTPSTVSES